VDGERSYRLARRGQGVDPAETRVTIHQAELVRFALPEVEFRVTVSPGTYVRAIARDLGERLGVGAHLTALRREAIGGLRVSDAVPLERVTRDDVLPVRAVLRHLPSLELDEPARLAVSHGRPLPAAESAAGDVALLHEGEVVAVARAADGWLRPSVVLGTP
jgi:tRNA pseudouridine55 synthase